MTEKKRNIISFMNMKGGVGKTTVCINIAGQLAKMGKSVLIIDIDPQMNASQYLLEPNKLEEMLSSKRTIYSLYRNLLEDNVYDMNGETDDEDYEKLELTYNVRENLSLICGDLNMTKVKETDGTTSDILNLYIQDNELKGNYDFIFIDCPPTQSVYTSSALKTSDFYTIVIKPDYLSTVGLSLFDRMIKNYNKRRQKHEKLNPLGIIVNLAQKGNTYHEQKISDIKNKYRFYTVFEHKINNIVGIAKSSEKQMLMHETKGCKTSISNLTKEFLHEYERSTKNAK